MVCCLISSTDLTFDDKDCLKPLNVYGKLLTFNFKHRTTHKHTVTRTRTQNSVHFCATQLNGLSMVNCGKKEAKMTYASLIMLTYEIRQRIESFPFIQIDTVVIRKTDNAQLTMNIKSYQNRCVLRKRVLVFNRVNNNY